MTNTEARNGTERAERTPSMEELCEMLLAENEKWRELAGKTLGISARWQRLFWGMAALAAVEWGLLAWKVLAR